MALQYDLAPVSGRTSLIPFGAARRELKFARSRTIQPLRASTPQLDPPAVCAPREAVLDLDALWRVIDSIHAPLAATAPPTFPLGRARPSPAGAALMLAIWRRRLVAAGLSVGAGVGLALDPTASIAWAAVGIAGAYLASALPKRAAELAQTARKIEAQFLEELGNWWSKCSPAGFADAKSQLEAARASLARLAVEEQLRIADLMEAGRGEQLERRLRNIPVGRDRIKGIGPRRLARLSAHGVETAFDVTASRLAGVPGIGPVTSQALLSWRTREESLCVRVPKPSRRDRVRIAMIKDEIGQRGAPLRQQLEEGPQRLTDLAASVDARRRALDPRLDELYDRWLQAGADLRICGHRPTPLPSGPPSLPARNSPATFRRAERQWRPRLEYAPS
jgi:hypothetical protein